VKQGAAGEVTITTLGVEGMPLLRYKTGDICYAHDGVCACGRTTVRIGPVVGRKQQMIKYKGTTLYPPAVFDILHQFENIKDFVVEAFAGPLGTDEIKLHVCVADHDNERILKTLESAFQSRLRVIPEIVFSSQKEIDLMQQTGATRKVRKFIDNR
jgi:phenylacetate-CoA ligase